MSYQNNTIQYQYGSEALYGKIFEEQSKQVDIPNELVNGSYQIRSTSDSLMQQRHWSYEEPSFNYQNFQYRYNNQKKEDYLKNLLTIQKKVQEYENLKFLMKRFAQNKDKQDIVTIPQQGRNAKEVIKRLKKNN